jgi:GH35 family endo-1,4-beta-xylanase/predicted  nucleic acid-binding Zn-ribbon protein
MRKRTTLLLTLFISLFSISGYAQIGKCKGKYFGNITAYSVPSNYTQLWNQTTSENGSKWGTCDRGNGRYDFGNSDLAYNTAKNSGGSFKFHALIWGAQAPGYLKNSSAAEIETAIRKWYQAVEDHYAPMGGLEMIDVLNEPVNTPINRELANLKAALTMGYQRESANQGDRNNPYGWAIWCFQLARKHFPTSELLINEFNTEHNWNNCRAEYIKMSNAIKNAPNLTDGRKNLIDGIGLQAHGIETLSANAWKGCIDEIWDKTGLPLHISEFDLAADPNETHQKNKFSEFISIAWEHPRVAGITLWGYVQGSTWRPGNGQTGASGTDTGIMYANGQDRPAMAWLRQYMASQPSLPCCPVPASFANCTNSGNPTVSLTAPLNNAAYTTLEDIILTATASDPNGTISKVEFFNGTERIGEDVSSPYSFTWSTAPVGSYSITAKATDNSGNTATSTAVTIRVNVPQGPYNGTWHAIPGTIQLENYDVGGNGIAYMDDSPGSSVTPTVNFRTGEDVDIENCTDVGGGYNIGFATAGEWLEYSVDVEKPGTYDLDLRVAADGTDRTVSVSMDGANIASNVAIPNTGGWQTWQTITVKNIDLKAGKQILRVTIGATSYVNLNYVTFKLIKELKQEPYKGIAHTIPGRIQAEDYDLGGEGLAFHEANADGNEGGADYRTDEVDIEETQDTDGAYNIAYIMQGEWLEYTVNVTSDGVYDLDLRMAADGDGKILHIEMDGNDVSGAINVPNTGGWQTWQTVTVNGVSLTAGEHIMRIVFDASYMNLNYVEFRDVITGTDWKKSYSTIEVFPNPFTNEGIQVNNIKEFTYKITNVNGTILESGNGKSGHKIGRNLKGGIYFLTIENNNEVSIHKIVKK